MEQRCMAEDIKTTHSIGQQDMLTLKTSFIAAKLKLSYKLFLYGISCTKIFYVWKLTKLRYVCVYVCMCMCMSVSVYEYVCVRVCMHVQ